MGIHNQINERAMRSNVRKYNEAKLEKEISFAKGFNKGNPGKNAWLRILEEERARRRKEQVKNDAPPSKEESAAGEEGR